MMPRWLMLVAPPRPMKTTIENTRQVRCLTGKTNPTIIEG